MKDVHAIFEFLKESTWIERLDLYGYVYSPDLIPELITELAEST